LPRPFQTALDAEGVERRAEVAVSLGALLALMFDQPRMVRRQVGKEFAASLVGVN